MKIKIDQEKLNTFVKSNLKYLPTIIVSILAFIFVVLTYLALYPRIDKDQVLRGQERVRNLDIRFNTKLLSELGGTKVPTELGTSGGRDPFAGF
jgi:hypothetical protein